MSSVRANWHSGVTDALPDEERDPFEGMNPGDSILTIKSTAEEFRKALSALNRRFGRLTAIGITCPLREVGECHCASCPISQLNDRDGERHQLCKQGVDEERTVMLARVAGLGELAASGV